MTSTPRVRPLSIAIAALGGQGGGVLSQWLVDLAEANGCIAQYTSVPGVAQRTGATIYCVEIFPEEVAKQTGKRPVMALMPAPGDVDIVVAAELMEAGRAIARGFVSPDLTTLIASDHRVYSVNEKQQPGDGRADAERVREAARKSARKLVLFDMQAAAEDTGSVISAVLFGAIAGSGALPFPREAFEATIRASGKAVESNLRGFALGYDGAQGKPVKSSAAEPQPARPNLPARLSGEVASFPDAVRETIGHGIARLVDYQDEAYARLYLDRLRGIAAAAQGANDPDHRLLHETARYLALWMGFEDVIRVADLKTRPGRLENIRQEVRARPDQIFYVVEYFHPRYEEFCDTLPAGLGRWFEKSATMQRLLKPLFSKGRNIQTAKLSGFLPLWFISKLRFMRRSTLRYARENALIEQWLDLLRGLAAEDYALAVEVAQCPRLIKGYGDTHARGLARYERILSALPALRGRGDAAERVRALRDAALADEEGQAFEATLRQVA